MGRYAHRNYDFFAQLRAVRALLDWSQDRQAVAAGVGNSTVRDFEAGRRVPYASTLVKMQAALEAAGVEFMNGTEPGVKLTGYAMTTLSDGQLRALRVGAGEVEYVRLNEPREGWAAGDYWVADARNPDAGGVLREHVKTLVSQGLLEWAGDYLSRPEGFCLHARITPKGLRRVAGAQESETMKFKAGDRIEISDENGVVRGIVLGPINPNDQGGALWSVRLDGHDGSGVAVPEKLMRLLDEPAA